MAGATDATLLLSVRSIADVRFDWYSVPSPIERTTCFACCPRYFVRVSSVLCRSPINGGWNWRQKTKLEKYSANITNIKKKHRLPGRQQFHDQFYDVCRVLLCPCHFSEALSCLLRNIL
mmetsp:Transcript_17090/g.24362  ORF Transcript_17090/g.24362 Transcript_17090/m.24362 type:complete len:119 (+) Transcript_17090:190-546(+)